MLLVYTNINIVFVENAKNILENAGIDTLVKNRFISSGFGEISGIDSWPELWVMDDSHYDSAMSLLKPTLSSTTASEEWVCTSCDEKNDASFEFCWNCQSDPQAVHE